MALLDVEDESVSFGGVQALRHVDLDVAEGMVTGLIGPNGAGAGAGAQLDLFPVGGWSDAHLFVEALRQIGPDVTRAKVIDVIDNQIERTDGGGMEPERTVGEVIPCFVMVKVVDQKWVREHPKSGYECELGQKIDF